MVEEILVTCLPEAFLRRKVVHAIFGESCVASGNFFRENSKIGQSLQFDWCGHRFGVQETERGPSGVATRRGNCANIR